MDHIEDNIKILKDPSHWKQGANSVDAAKIDLRLDEGKTVQEICQELGIVETCVQSFADLRTEAKAELEEEGFFGKKKGKGK